MTQLITLWTLLLGCSDEPAEPVDLQVFDEVLFYDGYAALVDEPVPEGVQRLRNDLVTRRIDPAVLEGLATGASLEVTVDARCDNYDRLASVNLAFVPMGATSYDPAQVEHIELGRFITPFMDKNREPDQVGYHFDLQGLGILADPNLWAAHDPWIELEIFGVPYAANTEIRGCDGRNDVFRGSLQLSTDTSDTVDWAHLIPVFHRVPFNNYQPDASDALGTTRRTTSYTLDDDAEQVQLVLIISHHGANAGGEEYNRREHRVRVDDERIATFVPGRESCEPFRELNTQPNGIYGATPRTDAEWQSFSNWCPGDRIETRRFDLGPQSAGSHEVVVNVPSAVFVDGQGDFPLSIYVLAR